MYFGQCGHRKRGGVSDGSDSGVAQPLMCSHGALGSRRAGMATVRSSSLEFARTDAKDRTRGMSNKVDKYSKRMRLGTRSCAECRRRRVRCVISPNSETCQACELHNVTCRPQQPSEPRNASHESDDPASLRRRLDELEAIVQDLQDGPLTRDRTTPFTIGSRDETIGTTRTESIHPTSNATDVTELDDAEPSGLLDGAPLISLIKSAMRIDISDDYSDHTSTASSQVVQDALQTISALLPRQNILTRILEATEPYWTIWPCYYYGPSSSEKIEPGRIGETTNLISKNLASFEPQVVAKALLWLALCIQQLPSIFDEPQFLIPAAPELLTKSYTRTARVLLDATQTPDIVTIECLLFQYKLHINDGKPRRGWLCTRQAMSVAFLQGLHRLDVRANDRQKCAWSQTWQSDVSFAMVLGLPYPLPINHPSLSSELAPSGPGMQIGYAISRITHKVIERDQQGQVSDYATTIRLDQEWEACRAQLPSAWFEESLNPSSSLGEIYGTYVAKMIFFNVLKTIHMPYMMKARSNPKFEHSRISAVQASREIIQSYQSLRLNAVTERVVCELMDFQAFSGGMVLLVDLTSAGTELNATEQQSDWTLIDELVATLKRTAILTDCPISSQGFQVLELLRKAYRQDGTVPRRYEATIPYFGKVCLTSNPNPHAETLSTTPSDQTFSDRPSLFLAGEIDFSVDMFDFCNLPVLDAESELGMEWTTIFQP